MLTDIQLIKMKSSSDARIWQLSSNQVYY